MFNRTLQMFTMMMMMMMMHKRSLDFLWVHFFLKKLTIFLGVVFNTVAKAKTAKLTT